MAPRASQRFNQSATFFLRFIPYRLQLSHDAANVSDNCMRGATMKWIRVTLLAIALAGCADSGLFDREKPVEIVTPTEQILPPSKPARPKAQTGKAQASTKTDAAKETSLLECASDACKAQCSLRIEKQSRPKWCLYFKEPIERPAASTPSGQAKIGSS